MTQFDGKKRGRKERPQIDIGTRNGESCSQEYAECVADSFSELGYDAQIINKVTEGRPHIVDELVNNKINLLINTTEGRQSIEDSASIRRTALQNKLFCVTTIFGAFALLEAMNKDSDKWIYNSLQEIN